ncbi:MAG: hypothetical protein ACOC8A_00150 [bacterium]
MRKRLAGLVAWGAALAVACAAATQGAPGFARKPTVEATPEGVTIRFEAGAPTDVAVDVVDARGKVVRHIAAGLLGPKAPAPLQEDTLSQVLHWDRRDDRGNPVPQGQYVVRVGLGLTCSFDRVMGWNAYNFGEIKGLAVGPGGDLYCLCGYGVPALLVFDRAGVYQRTLLPHSPELGGAKLASLKALERPDGVRVPFLTEYRSPYPFGEVGIGGLRSWGCMALAATGELLIAGMGGRRVLRMGADGSIPRPMLGPAVLPAGAQGVRGLAVSPDGRTVYAAAGGGERPPTVCRTAWGAEPGEPRPFLGEGLAEPKGPGSFQDIGGLATDPEGRVYVCDGGNDRVAVFSAAGEFLWAVPTPAPRWVAAQPRTGGLYVVSADAVRKLAGREQAREVWQLALPPAAGRGVFPLFALDAAGDRPVLWLGSPQEVRWSDYVLWRVEDLGDRPGEPREISNRMGEGLYSPVHLVTDPTRDEVYVREWREQSFCRFDGETGHQEKLGLKGGELDVGPDGLLYHRSFLGGSSGTWIMRYDRAGARVPFPEAQDIRHGEEAFWVNGALRGATTVGMKGFTVAPSGDIYILRYYCSRGGNRREMKKAGYPFPEPWPPTSACLRPLLDVYHGDGSPKQAGLIRFFGQGAAGVRVDRQGNIYVADHIKRPDALYPPAMAPRLPPPGDESVWRWEHGYMNWYLFNYGCIFKFPPQGGTITRVSGDQPGAQVAGSRRDRWVYARVDGAVWQYLGMSPVPADTDRGHRGGCVCANGRFDLDGFDRLFVPDVNRFAIDVLDSNANRITSFGRYGNAESRGPQIAFNWGSYVGVTRGAAYVCDTLNKRIVRVGLGYSASETAPVRLDATARRSLPRGRARAGPAGRNPEASTGGTRP